MAGVLCIGIAVQDVIYGVDAMPTAPRKYRARDLATSGGGLAASAAVAVARLGGRAMLATRLGDDLTRAEIVGELEREGVDTSLCRAFPGRRSPVSAVFVDPAGERLVMSWADPAMPTAPDWLPAEFPAGIDAVHGDNRWPEGAMHGFALARAAGKPSLLDCDRAPPDLALLAAPSHVAFSAQGLAEVTGEADPVGGLLALRRRGQKNWLAVTVGGEGVHWLDGNTPRHLPAFRVEVVDTLCAGDVWHGTFALALGERRSTEAALRLAGATAALKCTRFGGRAGTPRRAEVEAFLAAHP